MDLLIEFVNSYVPPQQTSEAGRTLDLLERFYFSLDSPSSPESPSQPIEHDRLARRGLRMMPRMRSQEVATVSLEVARVQIEAAIRDYIALESPDHVLLVRSAPGTGKSHIAVKIAEELAANHKRVLYAGPRHDLFESIRRMASRPADWYEWLPRRLGDEEGMGETCRHAIEIRQWQQRGHASMDFCKAICGWDYINNTCPYHAQKKQREPIIYGMHQHVFLGHPLPFHFVFGDEYPINAALHKWEIAGEHVATNDPFDRSPGALFLQRLQAIVMGGAAVEGSALLTALGGAQQVLDTLENIQIPLGSALLSPDIHRPHEVERVPFAHLFKLAGPQGLLVREAKEDLAGRKYIHRVIVHGGKLVMLLRRMVNNRLPSHVVWLDATGNEHLYEAAFGRPVVVVEPHVERRGKVYQVYNRANGISTLKDEGGLTQQAEQLKVLVRAIARKYEDRGLVGLGTFKDLKQEFEGLQTLHFGVETGSNDLKGVKALIVAGTPLPPTWALVEDAKMIFHERMEPFNTHWSAQLVPYNGSAEGLGYPVGGYWGDADLQAVVYQAREAKLVQMAERARLNITEADVWLLSNIPLKQLPTDRLLSINEVLDAPPFVDKWRWPAFLDLADECWEAGKDLKVGEVRQRIGLSYPAARGWIELLRELQPERWNLDELSRIKRRIMQIVREAEEAEEEITVRELCKRIRADKDVIKQAVRELKASGELYNVLRQGARGPATEVFRRGNPPTN